LESQQAPSTAVGAPPVQVTMSFELPTSAVALATSFPVESRKMEERGVLPSLAPVASIEKRSAPPFEYVCFVVACPAARGVKSEENTDLEPFA